MSGPIGRRASSPLWTSSWSAVAGCRFDPRGSAEVWMASRQAMSCLWRWTRFFPSMAGLGLSQLPPRGYRHRSMPVPRGFFTRPRRPLPASSTTALGSVRRRAPVILLGVRLIQRPSLLSPLAVPLGDPARTSAGRVRPAGTHQLRIVRFFDSASASCARPASVGFRLIVTSTRPLRRAGADRLPGGDPAVADRCGRRALLCA